MNKLMSGALALGFAMVTTFAGTAMAGDAGAGEALFDGKGRCKTCHKTTDAKSVGPGLAGVGSRHSDEWLAKWLADPQATWEENDAETQQLKGWKKGRDTAAKTAMKIPKLSEGEIADLIAFMKGL
jgi:cytochrome c2